VIKTLVLVVIACVLSGTGHVLLSKGMRSVGDLIEAPTGLFGGLLVRALANPYTVLGVVLQAAFFVMYLMLLSREDVSKILPLTAFDYIVMAILAQYLLAEPVTHGRWAGIGLIVAGVYLVSRT
jgi:drug/metabolite transporter (DMT)-like permease